MRPFNKAMRTLALATVLAVLGGCSEYLDRRDTIAQVGRQCRCDKRRDAHGRSVATRECQPQHRIQRRED